MLRPLLASSRSFVVDVGFVTAHGGSADARARQGSSPRPELAHERHAGCRGSVSGPPFSQLSRYINPS